MCERMCERVSFYSQAQFGTGDYDFKKYNMRSLGEELQKAQQRCEELRARVDPKVRTCIREHTRM
jgi:hypothetical protein